MKKNISFRKTNQTNHTKQKKKEEIIVLYLIEKGASIEAKNLRE